jgi:hypothetical protein
MRDLHPSKGDLDLFAIGKLDPLRAAMVEAHLGECDPCGGVVARTPHDDFIAGLHDAERQRPAGEMECSDQGSTAGTVGRQSTKHSGTPVVGITQSVPRIVLSPVILLPLLTLGLTLLALWIM